MRTMSFLLFGEYGSHLFKVGCHIFTLSDVIPNIGANTCPEESMVLPIMLSICLKPLVSDVVEQRLLVT